MTGDKASRDRALSVFKARAGKAREFCMDLSLPVGLPVRLAENDLRVPVEDIQSSGCLPPLAGLTRIGENPSRSRRTAMMHADLIDQDDFRERLQALGFAVPPDVTAEQACEYAVRALTPERSMALRRLVEELLVGNATLLPAVREAISRQLLPALVPRP